MEWGYDEFDADRVGGFAEAPAGDFHVEVLNVEEDGGKNGETIVDFEILAGNPAGHEGKTHREYFSTSGKAKTRLLTFACAVKLTTPAALKAAQEARQSVRIDIQQAIGRQCCIKIKDEEYEGKVRAKVGFRMWALDDTAAKGIPLNQGKLQQPPAPPSAGGSPPASDDPFGGGDDLFG